LSVQSEGKKTIVQLPPDAKKAPDTLKRFFKTINPKNIIFALTPFGLGTAIFPPGKAADPKEVKTAKDDESKITKKEDEDKGGDGAAGGSGASGGSGGGEKTAPPTTEAIMGIFHARNCQRCHKAGHSSEIDLTGSTLTMDVDLANRFMASVVAKKA